MPPNPDAALLRAELAALRRQVRVLFALLLVVLAGVGWLLVRGQRPAEHAAGVDALRVTQIETQEVRLLDPDGALRGLFYCPPAGPSLTLMDGQGRIACALSWQPPGLTLADGPARVRAAVGPDGPAVELLGADERSAARLHAGKAGGRLRLTDTTGRTAFEKP